MSLLEILIIIASASIVIGVLITSIINKKKGKTCCGDCSSCSACSKKIISENEKVEKEEEK